MILMSEGQRDLFGNFVQKIENLSRFLKEENDLKNIFDRERNIVVSVEINRCISFRRLRNIEKIIDQKRRL